MGYCGSPSTPFPGGYTIVEATVSMHTCRYTFSAFWWLCTFPLLCVQPLYGQMVQQKDTVCPKLLVPLNWLVSREPLGCMVWLPTKSCLVLHPQTAWFQLQRRGAMWSHCWNPRRPTVTPTTSLLTWYRQAMSSQLVQQGSRDKTGDLGRECLEYSLPSYAILLTIVDNWIF